MDFSEQLVLATCICLNLAIESFLLFPIVVEGLLDLENLVSEKRSQTRARIVSSCVGVGLSFIGLMLWD
jgi:hypothetical protein